MTTGGVWLRHLTGNMKLEKSTPGNAGPKPSLAGWVSGATGERWIAWFDGADQSTGGPGARRSYRGTTGQRYGLACAARLGSQIRPWTSTYASTYFLYLLVAGAVATMSSDPMRRRRIGRSVFNLIPVRTEISFADKGAACSRVATTAPSLSRPHLRSGLSVYLFLQ